ncbi:MAG TPA: helical backbone metal receptor [Thermoanaerobaculia bacterium]|nr:helical backbone metal receptor [Thermoanaerobaculia bacterium]
MRSGSVCLLAPSGAFGADKSLRGKQSRISTFRRARLLPALFAFLALTGCPRKEPAAVSAANAPQRLISLAPSVTETLFALGLGDRVVGVGDYTFWPAEALKKPRIGGLIDPNLERITALRPDLAVLLPSERDIGTKLAPLGVETLIVHNESLADIEASFRTIAARCGVPEAGEKLAVSWHTDLAPRPLVSSSAAPKVLMVVERQAGRLGELYVAGPGTYLDELLGRLGGLNVFADAPNLYPQASLEAIVARKPDLIFELRSDEPSEAARRDLIADWQPLAAVPAVKEGRIRVIAGNFTLIPGPRLPQLYKAMATAMAQPSPPAPLPKGEGGKAKVSSLVSPSVGAAPRGRPGAPQTFARFEGGHGGPPLRRRPVAERAP